MPEIKTTIYKLIVAYEKIIFCLFFKIYGKQNF